jgi:hypothetical protein
MLGSIDPYFNDPWKTHTTLDPNDKVVQTKLQFVFSKSPTLGTFENYVSVLWCTLWCCMLKALGLQQLAMLHIDNMSGSQQSHNMTSIVFEKQLFRGSMWKKMFFLKTSLIAWES